MLFRSMMNVTADGHLVVEAKGIYSVEKFLVARRLMYWQVYLHHTSVAAEQLLIKILERAKALAKQGVELFCSPALHYFLYNRITSEVFVQNPNALNQYAMLDDADLLSAIKVWIGCEDKVLSELCQCFTNRRLFKGKLLDQPLSQPCGNPCSFCSCVILDTTKLRVPLLLPNEQVSP